MTLEELIRQAGDFTSHASSSRTAVFRRAEVDEWGRTTSIRYPISNVVKGDGNVKAIVLQPADSVFVPVKVGYVKVSGEVHNPGLFPFGEGGKAMFYIDAAGGFLPAADKNRIDIYNRISRITSSHSFEVLVHDGDEIIVNVREELR
jgi:protein involved in polysaccharide export with SLBB domain